MSFERWGSLSVDDHVNTSALVANILLYDRLILPVMTPQADRDERKYWIGKGWDPDLQLARIDQLEDLAVPRPWDATLRARFRTRMEQLAAERIDADPKHATRRILAEEKVGDKPKGVDRVTVVAAYNSTQGLTTDFHVANAKQHLGAQAYLLSRRLAIPDVPQPEDALKTAIALSREPAFRKKRSVLFDWQELAVVKGWTPEETVARISDMTDDYNAAVKDAAGKVRWRFAFLISGIGLGFAIGGPVGAAAATATLSLLEFAKLDRSPAIEAGNAEPAAMFHDVERVLGLPLS